MGNGQEQGAANAEIFERWVAGREDANDWADYVRRGKLNRTEIAAECGFAKSALRQNPTIRSALSDLEDTLRDRAILPLARNGVEPQSATEAAKGRALEAVDGRIVVGASKAEQRIKALEEINATLRAENHTLRERLRRYEHIEEHLGRTGRLLPS